MKIFKITALLFITLSNIGHANNTLYTCILKEVLAEQTNEQKLQNIDPGFDYELNLETKSPQIGTVNVKIALYSGGRSEISLNNSIITLNQSISQIDSLARPEINQHKSLAYFYVESSDSYSSNGNIEEILSLSKQFKIQVGELVNIIQVSCFDQN